MSKNPEPDPLAGLLSLASSYMPSRVFLTAVELDVFGQLADEPKTAAQVASALGTDWSATEILLDALTGIGILTKDSNLYTLNDGLARFLVSNSPDYVGNAVGHLSRLWSYWSNLTQTIRDGQTQPGVWSKEMRKGLALAMKEQARESAGRLAALLDGSEARSLLDLGGGPGTFSIAMAQRFPQLRAVLCDSDEEALRLASSDVRAARLEDRIRILKVDFLTDEIGSGYDIVLLSCVLCTCSQQESRLLLKKAKGALKPGGRILIRDHMLDDTKTSPVSSALFSVCMVVGTRAGRVYSRAEVKSWLADVGFESVHWFPTEPMCVMIGTNPQP